MYADDTVLYYAHGNCGTARKNRQTDLISIEQLCQTNRLSLNVFKTKVMSFMTDHKHKTIRANLG